MNIWKKCYACYEGYYESGNLCSDCNGTSKVLTSKLSYVDEINRLHQELLKSNQIIKDIVNDTDKVYLDGYGHEMVSISISKDLYDQALDTITKD